MDNNDLKKWLTEQISYLEKTKEQPDKFAWDPEYDLQLAAFRLAIEALHGTCNHFREVTKMVPLTLEQLQEMNGEPVYDYLGQEWYVIQEYYGHELTMTDGTRFFDDDEIDGVDKRFYRRPPEVEA